MVPDIAKKYFEQAYKTGSDIWTHIPYKLRGSSLLKKLEPGNLVLDVGCGRGLWAFRMAELGLRVIGMDYIQEVVDKDNYEVKNRKLEGKVKFMKGDVLDIPFSDLGFDAVTDFGLLQHLPPSYFDAYIKEISRVIKPKGHYLNVSFSRETRSYLTWHPKASKQSSFEYDGIHHHFFTNAEMTDMFSRSFRVVDQKIEYITDHIEMAIVVTLFEKIEKK